MDKVEITFLKSQTLGEPKHYGEFCRVFHAIVKLPCHSPGRVEWMWPPCEIKKCVQAKNREGCWR